MKIVKLALVLFVLVMSFNAQSQVDNNNNKLRVEKKFMGTHFFLGPQLLSKAEAKDFLKEDRVALLLFKRGRRAGFFSSLLAITATSALGTQTLYAIATEQFYPIGVFGGIADMLASVLLRSYSYKSMKNAVLIRNMHAERSGIIMNNAKEYSGKYSFLIHTKSDTTLEFSPFITTSQLEIGDVVRYKQINGSWKYGYIAKYYNQQSIGVSIYNDPDYVFIKTINPSLLERIKDKQGNSVNLNNETIR